MALALLPLLCLGGVCAPALQARARGARAGAGRASRASRRVGEEHQGRLQGVLASISSLAAVIGPWRSTWWATARAADQHAVLRVPRTTFPGIVWLAGAALYVLCLPVLLRKGEAPDRPA
jgi:DHA1 family tetracycline resistance protein-like MFS transporter